MKRASWMYSCLAILVVAASAHGTTFFVDANGAVEKVSLVAVSAQYNLQSGVEVNIGGSVTVNALKSQNNGLPDVLP